MFYDLLFDSYNRREKLSKLVDRQLTKKKKEKKSAAIG